MKYYRMDPRLHGNDRSRVSNNRSKVSAKSVVAAEL